MLKSSTPPSADIDEWIRCLAEQPQEAELNQADRAIVEYALKLTVSPGSMVAGDVEALRTVGLCDRGIHDLASIVAYFAFVNRVADGLGVELEGKG